jgi:phosphoribosylamine--glycine ligase
MEEIEQRILMPTLAGMRAEGQPYRGVLYAGLMLTADGPQVLEFNCRFGDPECQLILPLLEGSLVDTCAGVAAGELRKDAVRWRDDRTYGVVLAARGYPDAPEVGDTIDGLETVSSDIMTFHAGTRRDDDGRLVTTGGRVLTLVGYEREAVYRVAEIVRFAGKQYRADIGVEMLSGAGVAR